MSDTTKAALEEKLAEHIADESNGIVTGYVLMVSYLNGDEPGTNGSGYIVEAPDGQQYHLCYGLAHQLVDFYRQPNLAD